MWNILPGLCVALTVPIARTYVDTFRIPLVGEQSIRMDVIAESHSTITLDGVIRSSGRVDFEQDDDGGLHASRFRPS